MDELSFPFRLRHPVIHWFRNERMARMEKQDKHFGIALLASLALSALIAIGAQNVVEHHAQTLTIKQAA